MSCARRLLSGPPHSFRSPAHSCRVLSFLCSAWLQFSARFQIAFRALTHPPLRNDALIPAHRERPSVPGVPAGSGAEPWTHRRVPLPG